MQSEKWVHMHADARPRRSTSLFLVTIAAASTFASGCATATAFDSVGNYTHPRYGYAVREDAVSDDWLLDNYAVDAEGRPTSPIAGSRFEYGLAADMDGDGQMETRATEPYWDLRFRHRVDAGELWVSTLPVTARQRATALRVLARQYVEAVSGTGLSLVQLGGELSVHERRFATRVLSTRERVLDGFEAFEVVFEVANVDQLELDANARWQRARVILVRPGLFWRPAGGLRMLPVIMTLGYVNHPDDFAANEGSLDQLLEGVVLRDPALSERSDAILACVPDAPVVSFLAVRNAAHMWTYRIIDPVAEDAARTQCLTQALDGFIPTQTRLGSQYIRSVPRPRIVQAPLSATDVVESVPVDDSDAHSAPNVD